MKTGVIAEDVSYEPNTENMIYAKAVLEEQRALGEILSMTFHYKKSEVKKW